MIDTLSSFSWIEWMGLLTGVIYVIFSAQNKLICWYFGIISCACIAYHDFFGGIKLYSDGVLQIFYIIMGVVGLLRWRKVSLNFKATMNTHILVISAGIILSLFYGYMMGRYSDASFPMVDAFTTIFSIIATVFLVNRQLSAWIYFIVIDAVMTYLFYVRGWELYALLYIIFTVVAIYAVWNWSRLFRFSLNR